MAPVALAAYACPLSARTRTGVAKSKRKRQQRKRRPGGHPARRTPASLRSPAEIEMEREAGLALPEAQRRYEEALSPDTPTERVAALVVEEFEDLPSPPGLAIRLRRDGSEERARAVAAEVQRIAPRGGTAPTRPGPWSSLSTCSRPAGSSTRSSWCGRSWTTSPRRRTRRRSTAGRSRSCTAAGGRGGSWGLPRRGSSVGSG